MGDPHHYMPGCQFIHCHLRYVTVHDTYSFREFLWKFHSGEKCPIITVKNTIGFSSFIYNVLTNQRRRVSSTSQGANRADEHAQNLFNHINSIKSPIISIFSYIDVFYMWCVHFYNFLRCYFLLDLS